MLYEYVNDYIDRTFKNEHIKNTALVLFNYMQNVLHDKSCIDIIRAIRTLETVHDIAVFNSATNNDIQNIVDMYNTITDFYDSSNYRVLYHSELETIVLVKERQYTRYVTDEIHDIREVAIEHVF